MEHTFNHIDELIGKYLSHEASAEERAILEKWLANSEANRRYFDQINMIFESANRVKSIPQFDTDAAWNKLKSKLNKPSEAKTITFEPSRSLSIFWRVAASIVIVLGIGFFTYRVMTPATIQSLEVATDTKSGADTLPDGSNVFLNKETQLSYTYDKRKKKHLVKLKGEAYFNIQHEGDKTFIVDVDGVFIKDIGTSFNVKGYPESNTIEVVVEEGEVMFYTDNNSGIYLKAGGKGIYHKGNKTFTVEEAEPNVAAYKTKFFIFSDSDLGTVIDQLNNVYDKQIIIDRHLRGCRLTVSFNNENVDEIASIIAETLGLTVKSNGLNIVLEGTSCEK